MNETQNTQHENVWKWTTFALTGILVALFLLMSGCCWGLGLGLTLGSRTSQQSAPPASIRVSPPSPDAPSVPLSPTSAWLGVNFESTPRGALVRGVVAGSPADEAGLREGDLIQAVDGRRVNPAHPLDRHIAALEPGAWVELRIERDGSVREMRVRLGARPVESP